MSVCACGFDQDPAMASGHLVLNDNPAFDEGAGTPATMSLASDSGPEGATPRHPSLCLPIVEEIGEGAV